MDDNRDIRDSWHSNSTQQRRDGCETRGVQYSSDRTRDYESSRSKGSGRDSSKYRSPAKLRGDSDRDRGDRNRSPIRRQNNDDRDRGRYHEDDYHHQYDQQEYQESSSSIEGSDYKPRSNQDWRLKLTNIRDAHFNRSKQPPSPFLAQNQFSNDGSFLEKFKQMSGESSNSSNLMPNSLVLASSSIKFDSEISLPPLTTAHHHVQESVNRPSTSTEDQFEDLDGVPITKPIPAPLPVSVGRRRTAKPLKTGVVFKKSQQSNEDEASQEKLDAWEKYLQEVQKYKSDNCVEEDTSRPLVK